MGISIIQPCPSINPCFLQHQTFEKRPGKKVCVGEITVVRHNHHLVNLIVCIVSLKQPPKLRGHRLKNSPKCWSRGKRKYYFLFSKVGTLFWITKRTKKRLGMTFQNPLPLKHLTMIFSYECFHKRDVKYKKFESKSLTSSAIIRFPH